VGAASSAKGSTFILDACRILRAIVKAKGYAVPEIPHVVHRVLCPRCQVCPAAWVRGLPVNALLKNDSIHWAILRMEWVVNVLSRWVDDAYYRGLLRYLPRGVRSGVDRLTVTALLQDGEYSVATIGKVIQLPDHHS
jgi:hypothetical protein